MDIAITDSLMKCVVVTIDDGEMVSVRRCVPMGGGDMIFPAEIGKDLIIASLAGKVDPITIEWLCEVWDKVLVYLRMHGGEAYVHADRVDVSSPEKHVFLNGERSAVR